jgi:DNA replication protein DnaC
MLYEQTIQKLNAMRLFGFAKAFQEQMEADDFVKLSTEERVSLMADREWTERETRRLTRRLGQAKLREKSACLEDLNYRHPRGLDRTSINRLASCEWVKKHHNIIITGPTGVGKTYIACAFSQKACREGYTAIYRRAPRLMQELIVARADGSYIKLLTKFAKTDVLVLDDWGLMPIGDVERRDLLEVLEDRHNIRSTVVASQLPVKTWHKYLGEPMTADAILDRLVHNAYKINLKGVSLRKTKTSLTKETNDNK